MYYTNGYEALKALMANNPTRIAADDPAWNGVEGEAYLAQVGDEEGHLIIADYTGTQVHVQVVGADAVDSDMEFYVLQQAPLAVAQAQVNELATMFVDSGVLPERQFNAKWGARYALLADLYHAQTGDYSDHVGDHGVLRHHMRAALLLLEVVS